MGATSRANRKMKLSSPYEGMGNFKGNLKEVNPTFSLKKAPVATPASKTQVNPTFSAKKSEGQTAPKGRRLNPTFAVTNATMETSKGTTSKKLVTAKSKVSGGLINPRGANPGNKPTTANKANIIAKNSTSKVLGFKTPTKNIKGGVGSGNASSTKPSKIHALQGNKDLSVPTRNAAAPFGPNGSASAPMTVKRLKKLGL